VSEAHIAPAADAEALLGAARRPLVLGIGGGGDVVGALAIAELCRLYHGAEPVVAGTTWERLAIDPEPGPRSAAEIEGARRLAPAVLAAGPNTRVRESGVVFAESRVSGLLQDETLLVDVTRGPRTIAAGLDAAAQGLGCELFVFLDVGGDVLGHGDEDGLASPLCDAVMLAAGCAARADVVLAVIGAGCDGELTVAEVLGRVAAGARAGAWTGTWSMAAEIADEVEVAARASYTEASMQVVRCARGEMGRAPIRGGRSHVELGPVGALTFFFDPSVALDELAPLAPLVADEPDVDSARAALAHAGIHSELDYERRRAAEAT